MDNQEMVSKTGLLPEISFFEVLIQSLREPVKWMLEVRDHALNF